METYSFCMHAVNSPVRDPGGGSGGPDPSLIGTEGFYNKLFNTEILTTVGLHISIELIIDFF